MPAGIFISYRRDDTIATAGRLHDRLARSFGRKRLFIDVDHIPVGADFIDFIDKQLEACGVLLAIIGPHWLRARDTVGSRRLDDPKDLVLIEIAAALRRKISVIPVLIDGAMMPTAEELPDALKPLARRNAFELRNAQFGIDADRLVGKIGDAFKAKNTRIRRFATLAVAIVPIVLAAWSVDRFTPVVGWFRSAFQERTAVESCDKTISQSEPTLNYSGIFAGILEDRDGRAEVQLRLARNGDTVQGSYFRAGLCGSVYGEVVGTSLLFNWSWAGSSGRGIANQAGETLNGSSGFKEQTQGGGTFVLIRRKPTQ
jgi:TIR domain